MFSLLINYKEPYEHKWDLLILGAIDDYNHYIGRVDIVD
jgi:hypothetical protein